jgi:hypothetical protein
MVMETEMVAMETVMVEATAVETAVVVMEVEVSNG